MLRQLRIAMAFAAFSLVSACGSQPDAGQNSRVLGLTTSRLWQKTDLTVCWDRQDQSASIDTQSMESAIAQALTQEYTKQTTVIAFSGFKDCTGSEDVKFIWDGSGKVPAGGGIASTIGLFPTDAPEIFAGIQGAAVKMDVKGVQKIQEILQSGLTIEDWAAQVATHEFGHIAGLFHEHAHPKSTCHLTPEKATEKFEKLGSKAADAYLDNGTAYDPYSVMSYCAMNAVLFGKTPDPQVDMNRVKKGLSDGDRSFLQSLYGGGGQSGQGGQGGQPGQGSDPNSQLGQGGDPTGQGGQLAQGSDPYGQGGYP